MDPPQPSTSLEIFVCSDSEAVLVRVKSASEGESLHVPN